MTAGFGWATGVVVGAALAIGGATAVSTQEAPAQDAPAKGEMAVPEPERCAVEPRPVADLERLVGATRGGDVGVTIAAASPAAEAKEPPGEPADPEAAAAATEALETLYACYNANDYPRAFALFTDAGLERALPGFGLTEKDLAYLAEQPAPVPAPKEAWRAVAVRAVMALPDGRLRAAVEGSAPDGPFAAVAVLVEEGGGYRIDDLSTTPPASDEDERDKTGA